MNSKLQVTKKDTKMRIRAFPVSLIYFMFLSQNFVPLHVLHVLDSTNCDIINQSFVASRNL